MKKLAFRRILILLIFANFTLIAKGEKYDLEKLDYNVADSSALSGIISELDQQIAEANGTNKTEELAFLLFKKGKYFMEVCNYSDASNAFSDAFQYIDSIDDIHLKYFISLNLGLSYSFNSMVNLALPYYARAYDLAIAIDDPLLLARAEHFYATNDLVNSNYTEAAKKLYGSYQVLEEYQDTTYLLYSTNDIGIFFAMLNSADRALEFLHKALHYDSLSSNLGNSFQPLIYANMSGVYSRILLDYDLAEKYAVMSLNAADKSYKWWDKIYANICLVEAQFLNGKFNESIQFLEQAYNDDRVKKQTTQYLDVITYYARNLFELKQYDKARNVTDEAVDLIQQAQYPFMAEMCYQILYKLDSIDGDNKSALLNYQRMIKNQKLNVAENGKIEFIRLEVEKEIETLAAKQDELLGTIDRLSKLTTRQKLIILLFFILSSLFLFELIRNRQLNKKLKKSEDALKNLNQQLEQKVKDRTQQLEKANFELLQLDDAKNEFLNIISHEIRTPLNGLASMLEIINLSELPEDMKEFIKIMEMSSERLEKFSYKALDISYIATKGKDGLTKKRADFIEFLKDGIMAFNEKSEAKGLSFKFNSTVHQLMVDFDVKFFEKVWGALIDNAIKFATENTQIDIDIFEERNSFGFVITDIGAPIPSGIDMSNIRPFKTANQHIDENPGLSLYLSKLIVEAHNGKLQISDIENGVSAKVILPR